MKQAINVNLFGISGVVWIAWKLFISACVRIVSRLDKRQKDCLDDKRSEEEKEKKPTIIAIVMIYGS